ncbi:MAG: hypothetical protein AAGG99_03365 [Pseudomonadota bacterium]
MTNHTARALKFLHTVGTVGVLGALACLLVLLWFLPPISEQAAYAYARIAMGRIADWVFMPALCVTLVAGLLSIAASRVFQNAGWVFVKLAMGILVFEASLVAVHGPVSREAERAAGVLAGTSDASGFGTGLHSEALALWIMVVLSLANVVLGVWRPRIGRL